jgi:hypothetical protein
MTLLMVGERPQSDIGRPFALASDFAPARDRPRAIGVPPTSLADAAQ